MTARFAVFGNPVAHSLSPQIHAAFADQFNIELSYERIEAQPGAFADAAERFFADPAARGANVTVPFKADARKWVDDVDPVAGSAGVVNTIERCDTGFRGYNTDGVGLVTDMRTNLDWPLENASVLLLGAGGAARGVVGALLDSGVGSLVVANRTVERAHELIADVADARACAKAPADLGGGFNIVINATSSGLHGDRPDCPARAVDGAHCYDMVYGPPTPFLRWASASGARTVSDGLGMLVEQAAAAFAVWWHKTPSTAVLMRSLRGKR